MMDLHYHLALNDQYITETSCHFDGASEEAVQSVITYIDVGPSGGIVDIFFKKMNNQVSFAQYQLHHLNASEFGIIELNILYSKTTSEKKEDQPLNKQFNIPGTKYTSHLKMAVVFNLSSLCEEPKIVYILLKDSVKSLHEQSSINAEEMETFSSDVDDGVPKNSQSNSTKSSAPYIPANIDENEMYVAQSETHAAPSMSKEQLQSEPSNVQSNSDPKDHLSYNLLLQHLSETTPAAADFKSLRHDFKALGNALSETVRKFFNGDYLVDILNMCSSSSPDITVKTNSDVTVNLYQVHNNISCHFPKVTNAVIGDGTIHSTSVWNGCNSDMHE
ncbi:hypothetical protein Btru_063465 [Bulinus truncatus]|nr:hypothetical protein Btru_063465 [Bulinus truncatus]